MSNKKIEMPNMLLLGAGDRNVGKTEFACRLINDYCNKCYLLAVKVTTVDKADGTCPRGGEGCGVCSSLKGKYEIIEETDTLPDKDTCKMLNSGAKKVLWLKVLKDYLHEGAQALINYIGSLAEIKDVCIICESNSLRKVIEPGLFLVLKRADSNKIKGSCKKVLDYSDQIINFNNGWDIDPDKVKFSNGTWHLKKKATAVVLAGGNSKRMGCNKAELLIKNRPLIDKIIEQLQPNFEEILICTNNKQLSKLISSNYKYKIVCDEEKGRGPLMGIYTGLKTSSFNINFVIACDIPEIKTEFVRKMIRYVENNNYQIVVPTTGENLNEPLFAVYAKSVLPEIEEMLNKDKNKISYVFDEVDTKYLELEEKSRFININTHDDYQNYISRL